MVDFCKCGSIKELGVCSNRRCPERDGRFCRWIIDGIEVKFSEPVTKTEAEMEYRTKGPMVRTSKSGRKLVVDSEIVRDM